MSEIQSRYFAPLLWILIRIWCKVIYSYLKLYDYKYESKGLLVKYVRKNLSTYMVIYRPSPNLV